MQRPVPDLNKSQYGSVSAKGTSKLKAYRMSIRTNNPMRRAKLKSAPKIAVLIDTTSSAVTLHPRASPTL